MEANKIPTAEEYYNSVRNNYSTAELMEQYAQLREKAFARHHLEKQLEAILNKACCSDCKESYCVWICGRIGRSDIINAYPLDKIK